MSKYIYNGGLENVMPGWGQIRILAGYFTVLANMKSKKLHFTELLISYESNSCDQKISPYSDCEKIKYIEYMLSQPYLIFSQKPYKGLQKAEAKLEIIISKIIIVGKVIHWEMCNKLKLTIRTNCICTIQHLSWRMTQTNSYGTLTYTRITLYRSDDQTI